jgi:secondary thiamine-phosphate synthase enzyme
MKQLTREITLATSEPIQFIDITDRVRDAFAASGIAEGAVTIFTRHTTTAVKVNERCERLQRDMRGMLERAVPAGSYEHDEDTLDGRGNGRGHLMAMLLGSSETIPVSGGRLSLGTWQSIFFVELDGPRPKRTIALKIMGE